LESTLSAVTIVAEVGELSRLAKPRQLMGSSVAVAREDAVARASGVAQLRRPAIQRGPATGYRRRGIQFFISSSDSDVTFGVLFE
jgi:hypothetical protein